VFDSGGGESLGQRRPLVEIPDAKVVVHHDGVRIVGAEFAGVIHVGRLARDQ